MLRYGDGELRIIANKEPEKVFKVTSRTLIASDEEKNIQDETCYLPLQHDVQAYPAATMAPSSATWNELLMEENVTVSSAAKLGERLKMTGNPEMADFGNAMHSFLSADIPETSKVNRIAMAKGLLERWGVAESIVPEEMLKASDRLNQFIKDHYPTSKVLREWPITLQNDQNQFMNGWIDLLLELPNGFVIIDHKSYPAQMP